jgi:hypothetical protein
MQRPVSPHLRAPFPERPKVYPSGPILRWQEIELLQWWLEDYSENALNALCEVHRQMVVTMAQKYVGAPRKIIIEYGMFGLRIAANRQRPNRKKKGKMAGYDPAKGRFSTCARKSAERFMRAADQAMRLAPDARGYFWEPPLADTVTELGKWAATPIPIENERADNVEPPKRWIDELIDETKPAVRTFDFDALAAVRRGSYYTLDRSKHKLRPRNGVAWHRYPNYFRDQRPASPASPDMRESLLRIRLRLMHQRDRYGRPANESRQAWSPPQSKCASVRPHIPTRESDPHCFCISATNFGYLVYWQEGFFVYALRHTKLEKDQYRNYATDPRTELERENRRKYYANYGYQPAKDTRILAIFLNLSVSPSLAAPDGGQAATC